MDSRISNINTQMMGLLEIIFIIYFLLLSFVCFHNKCVFHKNFKSYYCFEISRTNNFSAESKSK